MGAVGLVAGYGQHDAEESASAGVRRMGLVSVQAREGGYFRFGDSPVALPGDSGGPFFVGGEEEWVVGGIISFDGEGELCDEACGWAFELTAYRAWIEEERDALLQPESAPERWGCTAHGRGRSSYPLLSLILSVGLLWWVARRGSQSLLRRLSDSRP